MRWQVGIPVFFGSAKPGKNNRVESEDAGVRLQNGHKQQLTAFLEMMAALDPSQSKKIKFVVVGYASATPFLCNPDCASSDEKNSRDMQMNKDVANYRAENVQRFLEKERVDFPVLKEVSFGVKKWDDYNELVKCRPYRSALFSPDSLPERMNQSVMIFASDSNSREPCL